jgi:hypothetical protein
VRSLRIQAEAIASLRIRWIISTLITTQNLKKRMELSGFEPLTFSMPLRRATNCAIAPHFPYHPLKQGSPSTDLCSALKFSAQALPAALTSGCFERSPYSIVSGF